MTEENNNKDNDKYLYIPVAHINNNLECPNVYDNEIDSVHTLIDLIVDNYVIREYDEKLQKKLDEIDLTNINEIEKYKKDPFEIEQHAIYDSDHYKNKNTKFILKNKIKTYNELKYICDILKINLCDEFQELKIYKRKINDESKYSYEIL